MALGQKFVREMLYDLRLAQREIGKRVKRLPRRAKCKRAHASGMM
jgi:hypothetical protein